MYIKIKNKKLEVKECVKFSERFKTLKFVLVKFDYIVKVPNKKMATTYFFCQRVDICFTDKDDIILFLYENVKSEKRILKFKAKNVYYLPLGSCKCLKVGMKLEVKE